MLSEKFRKQFVDMGRVARAPHEFIIQNSEQVSITQIHIRRVRTLLYQCKFSEGLVRVLAKSQKTLFRSWGPPRGLSYFCY